MELSNIEKRARIMTLRSLLEGNISYGIFGYELYFEYTKEEYHIAYVEFMAIKELRKFACEDMFEIWREELLEAVNQYPFRNKVEFLEEFIKSFAKDKVDLHIKAQMDSLSRQISKKQGEGAVENNPEKEIESVNNHPESLELALQREHIRVIQVMLLEEVSKGLLCKEQLYSAGFTDEEYTAAVNELFADGRLKELVITALAEKYGYEEPIFEEDIFAFLEDERRQKLIRELVADDVLREYEPGVLYQASEEDSTKKITNEKVIAYRYLRRDGKKTGYFVLYAADKQTLLGTLSGELVSNQAPEEPVKIEYENKTYLLRKPCQFIFPKTLPLLQMLDCAKAVRESDETSNFEARVIDLFGKSERKTEEASGIVGGYYGSLIMVPGRGRNEK